MDKNYRPKIPERVRKTQHQYTPSFDRVPTQSVQQKQLFQEDNIIENSLKQRLQFVQQEQQQLQAQLISENKAKLQIELELNKLKSTDQFGVENAEQQKLKQYVKQLERQVFAIEEFMSKQGIVFCEQKDEYIPLVTADETSQEMMKTIKIEAPLRDDKLATLRLKTPDNQNILLKLNFSDGCDKIYQNLAELIGKNQREFQILRAIGGEVQNDDRSLEQVELVPNCRLFVKYL